MLRRLVQIFAIALIMLGTVTLPALASSTHSISGVVTVNSLGLKGVTVSIKGTSFKAVTDALGNYHIGSVPGGTSSTIVPSLVNYSFTPSSIKFVSLSSDLTGQNFIAKLTSKNLYTVSGYVKLTGKGLAGVTVTFGSHSALTNSLGFYKISSVPAGTTAHILPLLSGYGFSPTYISVYNFSANLVNQNFAAAVALTVSGVVTDQGTGLPLGGVTVSLGSLWAVSNATTGAYNIRNVPVGTSGALTPSLSGYTFNPSSITITDLLASVHSQNFVAMP